MLGRKLISKNAGEGELILPKLQYQNARIVSVGKEVAIYLGLLEEIGAQFDVVEFVFPDRRVLVKPGTNFFM